MKQTFYVIEIAGKLYHRKFEGGNYGTTNNVLDATRYLTAEATNGIMQFNFRNYKTAKVRKVTVDVKVA